MSLFNPAAIGSQRGAVSTMPRGQVHDATVATGTGSLRLSFFTADRSASFATVRVRTGTTAAAATPTLCRFGVFSVAASGDLTLIGSTVNDAALFAAATTAYPKALSAAVSLVAGGRYACGVLVVTGAAAPSMHGNVLLNAADAGLDERVCGFVGSQADLPSTVAAGSVTDSAANVQFFLIP